MAIYDKMGPVTLTFQITLDGVTAGGGVRAVQESAFVIGAKGPDAEFFGVAVNKFGGIYAFDSRKSKGKEVKTAAPAKKAAPAPVAEAPAPVAAKGKKAAAAPAMDIQAMIQAEIAKAFAAMTGK